MKSIKEKAKESSLGYDEVQAHAIGRGFVLGANYVLEQLEECFNPKDDIVTQWGAIATLIEQLKSNQ